MTPIVLICGNAGAGKDTVANILASLTGAAVLAQATPIKRFAQKVFGFSPESLFGASELRNAPDPRYDLNTDEGPMSWGDVYETMPEWSNEFALAHLTHLPRNRYEAGAQIMANWFSALLSEHGLGIQVTDEQTIMTINDLNAPVLTPRRVLQTFGTEFGRAVDINLWTDITIRDAFSSLLHHPMAVITDGRFRSEILAVKRAGGKVIKVVNPEQSSVPFGHASETELDTIPLDWFDVVVLNDKQKGLKKLEGFIQRSLFPALIKSCQFITDYDTFGYPNEGMGSK